MLIHKSILKCKQRVACDITGRINSLGRALLGALMACLLLLSPSWAQEDSTGGPRPKQRASVTTMCLRTAMAMSIARPIRAGRNAPTMGGNPRKDSRPSPRNQTDRNPLSAARTRPRSSSAVTGPGKKVTTGPATSKSLGSVAGEAVGNGGRG